MGKGLDQEQAELNARRNAVDDVLFKGFRGLCELQPLISNPNQKIDYESFFENFYKKRGDFSNFVSKPKTIKRDKEEIGEGRKAFEITVSADINRLKTFIKENLNKKR